MILISITQFSLVCRFSSENNKKEIGNIMHKKKQNVAGQLSFSWSFLVYQLLTARDFGEIDNVARVFCVQFLHVIAGR